MNSKSKQHSFFTVFVCGHKDTTILKYKKLSYICSGNIKIIIVHEHKTYTLLGTL